MKSLLLHRQTKGLNLLFPSPQVSLQILTLRLAFFVSSYVFNFRGRLQQFSALTYSDELNQGVVDEGSLRHEEAAPWT